MKNVNDYSYKSIVKNISPIQKFLFSLILMIITLIFNNSINSIFLIISLMIITLKLCNIKFKNYIKLLILPFGFLILAIIPILLNISSNEKILNESIIHFKAFNMYIYITSLQLITSINLFFKSLACVMSMYFFILTTPLNHFLLALHKLKIPKFLITLTELIYRYIFVLWEEALKVKQSQKSRLGYNNFLLSFKSTALLFVSVFIKAYNKTNRVYNGLYSRGYKGYLNGYETKFLLSKTINIVLVILIAISLVLFIINYFWLIKG